MKKEDENVTQILELPSKIFKSAYGLSPFVLRYLRIHKKFRTPIIFLIFMLSIIGASVAGYYCWYLWLKPVWYWGFNPISAKGILSVIGCFYLLVGPFAPVYFGFQYIGEVLSLSIQEEEEATKETFQKARVSQISLEEELQTSDKTGLVLPIRYSRGQMEAYYTIGLGQAKQSYRYSLFAMWIGFAVIVIGVALYIVPISKIQSNLGGVQILTISSGIVIELISGLFLWIYRSSLEQLKYFYNRQIYMHNILLGARIAESMKDSDATKRYMVEKILEPGWSAETIPNFEEKK